jgi:hypothetical protein
MSESVPTDPPSSRAALLLIRAWIEDPTGSSLRARVTEIDDIDAAAEIIRLASTRDELHATLDRWLDRLVGPELDAH